ncbi:nucleotidyltransferase domain-containing protein [Streptomyces sp. NPDC059639]|uniref:nucleotidyltransferase domain-containing protein n=1 Tax=Streptomyces sp. NPDC059639 TaxID=3346891 RepID=UPI00369F26D2
MLMDAANALAVIGALQTQSVEVRLGDGGWGVDALLGEQTRPHRDVDLIVRVDQAEDAVQALRGLGFTVAEGRLSSCFVLRDQDGRSVDVHPVVFDGEGNGNYTMENGEVWVYEAAWFGGNGTLQGEPVRCLTVQGQVACHAGYELDDEDRRDMTALHDRFGVDLLPEQRFGVR